MMVTVLIPFGMKGSKLVSDFLTDRKISLFDKRRQLVITDANGDIMWFVSQRPDNRFRITPKSRMALNILLKIGQMIAFSQSTKNLNL